MSTLANSALFLNQFMTAALPKVEGTQLGVYAIIYIRTGLFEMHPFEIISDLVHSSCRGPIILPLASSVCM